MADIARMRGIPELQERTLGDPAITVALLDGPVDLAHPCFAGAALESVDPSGLVPHGVESWAADHATHVASVLFGQPGSEVPGIAPRCSGLLVVSGTGEDSMLDPATLARALERAIDAGVDVVHCAVCLPSQTGTDGGLLLARALDRARAAGIPLVAPVGNDSGTAWCLPATSPHTLAVGSVDDHGIPAASTNHGDAYDGHGVMANGTRILGAVPGGGTIRMKGTSCAAPVATGVLLLLLSAARSAGVTVTAFEAARAIVAAATPYAGAAEDADRCVGGLLDPMAALSLLIDGRVPAPAGRDTVSVRVPAPRSSPHRDEPLPPRSPIRWRPGAPAEAEGADQSLRLPARVFALGRIDVDFGSAVHRDHLARLLRDDDIQVPPEDADALVGLLQRYPAEAQGLVWLLTQDDGRLVYALQPDGAFAPQVWSTLVEAYQAFHGAGVVERPERVSLPGILVDAYRTTATGLRVPVLVLPVSRGLYAWSTRELAASAAGSTIAGLQDDLARLLDRGYLETANPGDTAPARALNYSLTNAVGLAWSLAQVRGTGRSVQSITVRRSRFSRPRSDCWDVVLTLTDPEDELRAPLLHRHTVDVADIVPVSVGQPVAWYESP